MKRVVLLFVTTIAMIAFGSGTAGARGMNDRDFVKKTSDGDLMEISLGRLAEHQATDPDVKRFGERMIKDHTQGMHQLQSLASKIGLEVSRDMDREEQDMVHHLSTLKGSDFDRAFMKHMAEDHKEDIQMFERMAKESANPELRNYARQTLPLLREHLQMAEDIYNKIKREQ